MYYFKLIFCQLVLAVLFVGCKKEGVDNPQDDLLDGKTLVWSDEFDDDGTTYMSGVDNPVDDSKWFHQTKLPNGWSWYNDELQHYTNRIDNSYVSDGTLKIVAKKEVFSDQGHTKDYTSARLNAKHAFTYGVVEIRAKLPQVLVLGLPFGLWGKTSMRMVLTGNSKGLVLFRGQLVERLILWSIGAAIKTLSKVPCILPLPMGIL